MPGTFRGFLQGLGAALPRMADTMMQVQQLEMAQAEIDLKERDVALREEQWKEMEPQRDVQQRQAEALLEHQDMLNDFEKATKDYKIERERLSTEMKKTEGNIYSTNYQMLQKELNTLNQRYLDEAESRRLQNDKLAQSLVGTGFENQIKQVQLITSAAAMSAQLELSPEIMQKMDSMEFNTVSDVFKFISTTELPASFKAHAQQVEGRIFEFLNSAEVQYQGTLRAALEGGMKYDDAVVAAQHSMEQKVTTLAPFYSSWTGFPMKNIFPFLSGNEEADKTRAESSNWLRSVINSFGQMDASKSPYKATWDEDAYLKRQEQFKGGVKKLGGALFGEETTFFPDYGGKTP